MRTDRILSPNFLTFDATDRDEIERFNDILEKSDAGRPLGRPGPPLGSRVLVPVETTRMDAREVHDLLDRLGITGSDPADSMVSGAIELTEEMIALLPAGKSIGHGFAFTTVEPTDVPAVPWDELPPHLRRPVVALLDSGVRAHGWLPPHEPGDDPFVLDAERHSTPWDPMLADPEVLAEQTVFLPEEVSHVGHATFLAGLIHKGSPSAQVLSVRVMDHKGLVNEKLVTLALRWLNDHYLDDRHPVDVVCMAFGRLAGDAVGSGSLDLMEAELNRLSARGVQLVASAGNEHVQDEIYPAAFPVVTAVGAGFQGYHATFSNHGDKWVDRYRDGVHMLSTMPHDKWALWSGTSFAAAAFAADLARPRVA